MRQGVQSGSRRALLARGITASPVHFETRKRVKHLTWGFMGVARKGFGPNSFTPYVGDANAHFRAGGMGRRAMTFVFHLPNPPWRTSSPISAPPIWFGARHPRC
jgi:hypothetical protein